MRLAPLFLFLGIALGPAAAADDIDSRRGELATIKREIDEGRRELGKLSNKESDLVRKLQKLDDNITLMSRYLRKLGEQETALSRDIDSIQADLTRNSSNLGWRRELLKRRVRRIYMRARYGEIDMLFSAASISDFFRRNAFFKVLADHDQRLIDGIWSEQRQIRASKTRLESRLSDVHAVKAEKEREQRTVEEQRKNRRKILDMVKGQKQGYLKLVKDLEKRKAEINRIIDALEEARRKSREAKKPDRFADYGNFGKLRGRLPWPAAGKILARFGTQVHPVYQTKTINNGIDIEARAGSEIKSVAAGEVVYTGTLSSFGNFVIVGHSDGFYSLYANLSFIGVKKGQSVTSGGALGLSGDSGSMDGAKLHFEIRQERRILNPLDWLTKRK